MINKVAKGTRKEKACADELEAKGYIIRKSIRIKYQKVDFFGFDVMALAADGSHMLFVQVKSNRCDTATRDRIKKLKLPASIKKEIWIWKDRKYFVKEYYD